MKSILQKQNELKKKSVALRTLAIDEKGSYESQQKIRKEQDKVYKQWKFYKNISKYLEK